MFCCDDSEFHVHENMKQTFTAGTPSTEITPANLNSLWQNHLLITSTTTSSDHLKHILQEEYFQVYNQEVALKNSKTVLNLEAPQHWNTKSAVSQLGRPLTVIFIIN